MEAQKTVLFENHLKLGAKMTEFAGWVLPLWYSQGQTAEHLAVRNACGLFDICHMGEFKITGRDASSFLGRMLTNRVQAMQDGQAMYHFMLNEAGGVIDDCILYRWNANEYMLVVNAANIERDFQWLSDHIEGEEVYIKDISAQTAKLDLQGPKAPQLMSKWIAKQTLATLRFFRFLPEIQINGIPVLVSRTGYTGDVGFELYTDVKNAVDLWELLLEEGASYGLLPCGLASRDSLRIEAGLPLHGHELSPDRIALGHPWEFVFFWEKEFLGKKALLEAKAHGEFSFVLPFAMNGPRKAMPGWDVYYSNEKKGKVLSAVISPSLSNRPIGFLESSMFLESGTPVQFCSPDQNVTLQGEIARIPFLPLTARKSMEEFLF